MGVDCGLVLVLLFDKVVEMVTSLMLVCVCYSIGVLCRLISRMTFSAFSGMFEHGMEVL